MGWVAPVMMGAQALMGGLGGLKKQKASQTQESTKTEKFNTSDEMDQFTEAVEDPMFSMFRQALMPMYGQEVNRANRPIYGDAEKAGVLSNLTDLADSSAKALKGQMASTGMLGSGAATSALSGIQQQKFGQAADFFSKLPQLESEARSQRMGGLLGMGMNWAGRAPISQHTTGTASRSGESTSTTKGTGTSTQDGPGFWSGLQGGMSAFSPYIGKSMDALGTKNKWW